jgi:ATP synthase protein I
MFEFVNVFTSSSTPTPEMASDLRKRDGRAFDGMRGSRLELAPQMDGPRKNDAWSGVGVGWSIVSHLIGAMVVVGGLGYLLDRIFDTGSGFTALGIVLGAAFGIYIVYVRYGKGDQ